MPISRRTFLRYGASATLASTLAAPSVLAAEPIRIGVVQPFSGGLELFGNQAKLGLDLAAAEINAAGGILGRQVEIVYEDDKTDPEDRRRAHHLADSPRRGRSPSRVRSPRNNRDAMMPTLSRAKVPLLYATNYEGGGCDRYLFCFNTVPEPGAREAAADDEGQGRRQLLHVRRRLRLAAEDVRDGEEHRHRPGWQGRRQGVHAVGRQGVRTGDPAHQGQSGAKVLVFALPGADGITFIRQAEDLGLLEGAHGRLPRLRRDLSRRLRRGQGAGHVGGACRSPRRSTDPAVKEFVADIRKSAGAEHADLALCLHPLQCR